MNRIGCCIAIWCLVGTVLSCSKIDDIGWGSGDERITISYEATLDADRVAADDYTSFLDFAADLDLLTRLEVISRPPDSR